MNWTLIRLFYDKSSQYWVAVWEKEGREITKRSYWRRDVETSPERPNTASRPTALSGLQSEGQAVVAQRLKHDG